MRRLSGHGAKSRTCLREKTFFPGDSDGNGREDCTKLVNPL